MRLSVRNIITNAILCDDIREENNGKHLLIGVYSGDVIVNAPEIKNLLLSVYMELRYPASQKINISFRIRLGKEIILQVPPIDIARIGEQEESGVFRLGGVPISTREDTQFKVEASINEGTYTVALRKNVKLLPSPGQSSNAIPQPSEQSQLDAPAT